MNAGWDPPERRMSSKVVVLGGIVTVAAVIVGVAALVDAQDEEGEAVTADCVDITSIAPDGSYEPVDDRFCTNGSHHSYVQVYGGSYSGGRIHHPTRVRPGDAQIVTRKGTVIQRGGFGGRGSGGS